MANCYLEKLRKSAFYLKQLPEQITIRPWARALRPRSSR